MKLYVRNRFIIFFRKFKISQFITMGDTNSERQKFSVIFVKIYQKIKW